MPLNCTVGIVKMLNFMLCAFYQNKKKKTKERPKMMRNLK